MILSLYTLYIYVPSIFNLPRSSEMSLLLLALWKKKNEQERNHTLDSFDLISVSLHQRIFRVVKSDETSRIQYIYIARRFTYNIFAWGEMRRHVSIATYRTEYLSRKKKLSISLYNFYTIFTLFL